MTVTTQTTTLQEALIGTFDLYRRTHLAHWNVKGPHFHQLHVLFEEQYTDMWNALDDIAERIRALGEDVPASSLGGNSEEDPHEDLKVTAELAAANESFAMELRELEAAAASAGDAGTADLLTQRIQVHEKFAWMLRATIA